MTEPRKTGGNQAELDNCTNVDKKDAYTYFDPKVTVSCDGADIKGYYIQVYVSLVNHRNNSQRVIFYYSSMRSVRRQ